MVPRPAAKFPNVARPPLPAPPPPLALSYGDLFPVASRFCCLFIKCEFVVDENFNWMRRTRNVARQLFRTHNSHGNFAPKYILSLSLYLSLCALLFFFVSNAFFALGKYLFHFGNENVENVFLTARRIIYFSAPRSLLFFYAALSSSSCSFFASLASALIFYFCFEESMIYLCAVWFDLNLNWGRVWGEKGSRGERVG